MDHLIPVSICSDGKAITWFGMNGGSSSKEAQDGTKGTIQHPLKSMERLIYSNMSCIGP